jgi:glycosyltransferase involved in cell wall biosynthesis
MLAREFPMVSAIVPAFNAEHFIGRTLESILTQTYARLEVIVVDDGSTDGTTRVIEDFCRRDSRVRLLRQANAGVSAARNLAIANSVGEFIAPIDADDLWYPTKIEKQLECFAQGNNQIGLVYTWSAMIDEADRLNGRWSASQLEGDVYLPLIYRNFVGNASAPLIRRHCLEVVGSYNLNLKVGNSQGAEDWDLYLRIAEQFTFGLVPEFLTGYRQLSSSMSRNYSAMETFVSMVLADAWTRHPKLPRCLLRWALSDLYLTFAKSTRQAGQFGRSIGWLLGSAARDPVLLVRPAFHRLLAANLRDWLRVPAQRAVSESAGSLTLSELEARVRTSLDKARREWQVARVEALAANWKPSARNA